MQLGRWRRWFLITISLLLVVTACDPDAGDGADGIQVVATTSIWGDVAGNLVGDDGTVEVLIPIGADPHDYQASASQVTTLLRADLVIANGLGLEEGLHDVLENAVEDGANLVEVAPELDPLPFAAHDHQDHEGEEGGGDEHENGDLDPHVWLDPLRVAEASRVIAGELTLLDDSIDWSIRADLYAARLEQADSEIETLVEEVPQENHKLVTNHEAFGYFADRYGFEIVGVVIPGGSTLDEPSSAELGELVDVMEHEGISTIFAETSQPTRLAAAVAAELGREVQVVELYSGSLGEPGSGADDVVGMLLTDARLIAEALS